MTRWPLALTRDNAFFGRLGCRRLALGRDRLTYRACKLNSIDRQAYLADVITRIVAGQPQSALNSLLPWANAPQRLRAVA